MTPSKRAKKEAGDIRKQPSRAVATANLTEMSSDPAGPSSGTKAATKRRVTDSSDSDKEVESSKKSKVLPEDESDDEDDIESVLIEVTTHEFFQDRTLIIQEFVKHGNEWIVDNKPHRFGKTTDLISMVLYLSRFLPLKNSSLFQNTKISRDKDFEEKYFKKCDVFYLNFKIRKHEHIFETVVRVFKKSFDDVKRYFPKCDLEFNPEKLCVSLTELMHYVKRSSRARYVFIDEYDSVFVELYEIFVNGPEVDKTKAQCYANELYELLDTGHEYAYRFFITGIVALDYQDLFSDNRMIFSQGFELYNKPFHQFHLITLDEVVRSKGLHEPPNDEIKAKLVDWYGGYTLIASDNVIGNYLNLYSVLKYYLNDQFEAYFNTSGCTRWLRKFFKKENVILYINGILNATGEIRITLKRKPFLRPQGSSGRNDVLSLLVHCGYLVLISKVNNVLDYSVKIPNTECRTVLQDLVRASLLRFLPDETGTIRRNLFEAFVLGTEDCLRKAFEEYYASIQGNIRYEETHCLLLENSFIDFQDITVIPFNTPAGSGKCDGIFLYKNKGYVAEFKTVPPSKLPEADSLTPDEYDTFCADESVKLLTKAENQHVNQKYIDVLRSHSVITEKYRLLIAVIQKRVFLKLKEI